MTILTTMTISTMMIIMTVWTMMTTVFLRKLEVAHKQFGGYLNPYDHLTIDLK